MLLRRSHCSFFAASQELRATQKAIDNKELTLDHTFEIESDDGNTENTFVYIDLDHPIDSMAK